MGGRAFGMEALKVAQGVIEGPTGGIDAPLEEREVFAAADEIQTPAVGVIADAVVIALVVPDFGVGEGVAAEEPVGVDESGDEEGLFGSGGLPAVEVLLDEVAEFVGVFAFDDLEAGVEAVLRALALEAALPRGVRGPVDFWALRRLAAIRLGVLTHHG